MITLIPAYGRDYKNQKSVRDDWNNNKDFIICDLFSPHDGRYANKEDLQGQSVQIRYANKTKILVIK
jgi:hypothetical protein